MQQNPKLSISSNECHYTTLWNTTCVKLFITAVMQALNVMTNLQLRTNTSQQMFKVSLTHALRRFCHWLIAWSVMLCWIPDHASIVSSRTFAECLCVWCAPMTSALREMPVSLAIWRVVLYVPGAPSWLSTKSLTASMFSAVRDVRGLPVPVCQSVVPVFTGSKEGNSDCANAIPFVETL